MLKAIDTEKKLFWLFALAHVVLWTALPTLVRFALPMDANEGYMWGQHLSLGYDRDPWLNAVLTRFAVDWGGQSGVLVYLLSQLCVLLAFWSVWQLGKEILSPSYALMCVFCLEGVQYYHLAAIDFNDNVLELGLWPFMAWAYYFAVKTNRLKYWTWVGISAGLGVMAKYYTIFPLVCMGLFLLMHPQTRALLKAKAPWIALLIFTVIVTPHFIWLVQHDYVTLTYSMNRTERIDVDWYEHAHSALRFFFSQVGTFAGALVVFFSYKCWQSEGASRLAKQLPSFDWRFLWVVGVGPFLLTVVLGAMMGWQVNTMWGTPLLSLWPLLLAAWSRPYLNSRRVKGIFGFALGVSILIGAGYVVSLTRPGTESSANFPAQEIAQRAEALWAEEEGTPLAYVAGDRYLTSYVVYYHDDPKPKAFIEWSKPSSHWVDERDFKEKGAVFMQVVHPGSLPVFPVEVMAQYPRLKLRPVESFNWHRPAPGQRPVMILFGVLPALGNINL